MAVSDRIAVMKDGVIQQLGTPQELYHRPCNLFVATCIGRSNVMNGLLEFRDGAAVLTVAGGEFVIPGMPSDGQPGEAVYRLKRLTASYMHLYFPFNPAVVARLFLE